MGRKSIKFKKFPVYYAKGGVGYETPDKTMNSETVELLQSKDMYVFSHNGLRSAHPNEIFKQIIDMCHIQSTEDTCKGIKFKNPNHNPNCYWGYPNSIDISDSPRNTKRCLMIDCPNAENGNPSPECIQNTNNIIKSNPVDKVYTTKLVTLPNSSENPNRSIFHSYLFPKPKASSKSGGSFKTIKSNKKKNRKIRVKKSKRK
jgi:hypothetical protein